MDDDELRRRIEAAPVNRLLGHRLVRRDASGAECRLPPRRDFLQEGGRIHGGLLATLADSTAVYALLPELPPGRGVTSIDLKLDFLRPALPDRGDLLARARIVRLGRRVAVCDVEVEQADQLVAKGLLTYLVLTE